MEPILDHVAHGRVYARMKREHDRQFEAVCDAATWYTTKSGKKLAVVEASWVGAPGALYGKGADVAIALNPEMRKRFGKGTYRKFTVTVNSSEVEGLTIFPVLTELLKLEEGWGGPDHGGICGSPIDTDSVLSMEVVVRLAIEWL
jgi:hypothetical protein